MQLDPFYEELLLCAKETAETVVEKVWGTEYHVVNNEQFCLKYLVFKKGGKLSRHKHAIKKEMFICLTGVFGIEIGEGENIRKGIFLRDDKILLEPNTAHLLEAFYDSIILEISTQDFASDSYRLEPSSFNADNSLNIFNYARTQVGLISGCFDGGLHDGHIHLLKEARQYVSKLIIALNSDEHLAKKGAGRPILTWEKRKESLLATGLVDEIIMIGDSPRAIINEIKPDVILVGDDYKKDEVVGAKERLLWGGKIIIIPRIGDYSTTKQHGLDKTN